MPSEDERAGEPGAIPPVAPASLFAQSIGGRCPRCHSPTLFVGMLRFADRCSGCGLDFSQFNVGDGPAAFLTLGIGTIITILAIIVELRFEPPWWVHAALWPALTIGSVLIATRWGKAALLALEYRNGAREGQVR